MTRITIPRAVLRATLPTMGKADVRFYLNGALLEIQKGHAWLVSTDGTVLGAHKLADIVEGEPTLEVTIPRDVIAGVKRAGSFAIEIDVSTDGKTVSLIEGAASMSVAAVGGKFPDWRRVMSAPAELTQRYHYDPALTARFSDVASALYGASTKRHPLFWPAEGGSAVVAFENEPLFRGVVMPLFFPKGQEPIAPSVDLFKKA